MGIYWGKMGEIVLKNKQNICMQLKLVSLYVVHVKIKEKKISYWTPKIKF